MIRGMRVSAEGHVREGYADGFGGVHVSGSAHDIALLVQTKGLLCNPFSDMKRF